MSDLYDTKMEQQFSSAAHSNFEGSPLNFPHDDRIIRELKDDLDQQGQLSNQQRVNTIEPKKKTPMLKPNKNSTKLLKKNKRQNTNDHKK